MRSTQVFGALHRKLGGSNTTVMLRDDSYNIYFTAELGLDQKC